MVFTIPHSKPIIFIFSSLSTFCLLAFSQVFSLVATYGRNTQWGQKVLVVRVLPAEKGRIQSRNFSYIFLSHPTWPSSVQHLALLWFSVKNDEKLVFLPHSLVCFCFCFFPSVVCIFLPAAPWYLKKSLSVQLSFHDKTLNPLSTKYYVF